MHYRHPCGDVGCQIGRCMYESGVLGRGQGQEYWCGSIWHIDDFWCHGWWHLEKRRAQVRVGSGRRASIGNWGETIQGRKTGENIVFFWDRRRKCFKERVVNCCRCCWKLIKIKYQTKDEDTDGNALHLHRTFWFSEFSNTLPHTSGGILNPFGK